MHFAQIDVAKIVHDVDGPQMADFVAALKNINVLADRSPGFVWRLIGDGGDATDVRFGDESDLLINMSLWADIESLRAFVSKTAHAAVMARRGKWFPALGRPYLALWWVAECAAPRRRWRMPLSGCNRWRRPGRQLLPSRSITRSTPPAKSWRLLRSPKTAPE